MTRGRKEKGLRRAKREGAVCVAEGDSVGQALCDDTRVEGYEKRMNGSSFVPFLWIEGIELHQRLLRELCVFVLSTFSLPFPAYFWTFVLLALLISFYLFSVSCSALRPAFLSCLLPSFSPLYPRSFIPCM
mmetsp:Transcript_16393/g.33344  ORF Transcript_16393/g.33344 Transcript_16393/m.33344 type:complete len:131 (+) Transcript_16393:912-1304(+)